MEEIGENLKPGNYRLQVSFFSPNNTPDNTIRYSAELFAALLNAKGINTTGLYRRGTVENGAKLIYSYESYQSVSDMVRACLKYSNNFIANQLFLSCGAKLFGYPATWEKGYRAMRQTLADSFGIEDNHSVIIEGSGLSRKSLITPSFMLSILQAFRPYAHLLQSKDTILIKSGTMEGIYCYAGYFSPQSVLDPFVIFLNQSKNSREQVLTELHRTYLTSQHAITPRP